jgi:hypothetical protein
MIIDYMSDNKLDYRSFHARRYDETSDVDRDGCMKAVPNIIAKIADCY